MPKKPRMHKKAQSMETIILIVATILIILIAGLFTLYISTKSENIKQKMEASNKDMQKKILFLNLLATDIIFDGRAITLAEALNLAAFQDQKEDDKSRLEKQAILTAAINNFLKNLGYDGKNKVWQIAIYLTYTEDKEKLVFEVTQANTAGLVKKTIEAEQELPTLNLDKKYMVKLITLED